MEKNTLQLVTVIELIKRSHIRDAEEKVSIRASAEMCPLLQNISTYISRAGAARKKVINQTSIAEAISGKEE